MHRRRKVKRTIKKQRKAIIFSVFAFLFILSIGYATFQTNISLKAIGNIKDYNRILATTYITNLYNNGDTTLIDDGTEDHNIRYSGKPVNNYVCIENEKPCTDENLYRIIGTFNNIKTNSNGIGETRIKLVKAISLLEKEWDESGNNNWARPATLNIYLNNLELASNELIEDAVWNLGGNSSSGLTSKQIYSYERGTITGNMNTAPATWSGKIALIYPSDYGFASKECYNTRKLFDANADDYRNDACKDSNWLYGNLGNKVSKSEWFLTPNANTWDFNYVYYSCGNGAVCNYPAAVSSYSYVIRPSFYLKSNVNIIENGNDGSELKPYYLELGD